MVHSAAVRARRLTPGFTCAAESIGELAEKHFFEWPDPMLRIQTPFFTFPFHYDCYGNVLIQLSGLKRCSHCL
eukprot:SAG11_NODE_36864_length_259_cov_1.262500_1_plen_72_part_01